MLRLTARNRDLGGTFVRRVLPDARCRKVGPWVFLDHFGPERLLPGRPMDVRPHPHCALSTVTWLFDGAVEHRDSTGGHAIVRPGEIHWMRAGHGIVHSERTPVDRRDRELVMHGLQLWCAHPDGQEEQEPRFGSWRELPELDVDGVHVHLLAGHGWGAVSPVDVTSPLIYAVATLSAGAALALPDHPERCAYAVSGAFAVDGERAGPHEMLVLDGRSRTLIATEDAVVALLGGDPIGPRHMWWNLIHSDRGRLEEQARRWREDRFPKVPGDGIERIEPPPGP